MQTRLRNFKNDLLSFEHNVMNLGLHNPGRYAGFDTINIVTDPLGFTLTSTTGARYKTAINQAKGPMGVWLTPQGVIIMEDEALNFTIETNAGNPSIRYDLIIANHNFVKLAGGQNATYSIIKGPLANAILPALLDPLKQIILGVLEISPGATAVAETSVESTYPNPFYNPSLPDSVLNQPTLTRSVLVGGVSYQKSRSPDSGDGVDARIYEPNNFQALQQRKKSSVNLLPLVDLSGGVGTGLLQRQFTKNFSFNGVGGVLWELPSDGNIFKLVPNVFQDLITTMNVVDGIRFKGAPIQEGAEIKIFASRSFMFRDDLTDGLPTDRLNEGYRGLRIPLSFKNSGINGGTGVRAATGEIWLFCLTFNEGKWQLTDIQNRGSSAITAPVQTETGGTISGYSMLDRFGNPVVAFDAPRNFKYYMTNISLTEVTIDCEVDGAVIGMEAEVIILKIPANYVVLVHGHSTQAPTDKITIMREGPYAIPSGTATPDNNYRLTIKYLGRTKDPAPGGVLEHLINYKLIKIDNII